jgi:hypothetical protein
MEAGSEDRTTHSELIAEKMGDRVSRHRRKAAPPPILQRYLG